MKLTTAQQKQQAALRRTSPAHHILGNAGLTNVDAELEQFAVESHVRFVPECRARTKLIGFRNVRFGSKADICSAKAQVRFTPNSGHSQCKNRCPLCAKSGLAKKERPRRGGLSQNGMHLGRSTRALRQARTGTESEARVDLRCARSDLQRVIGSVQKKNLFLCFQNNIRHQIDPFVCALAN